MKHSPKSLCPARLFAQSFHGWMAARFLGANSVYQAQGETPVNPNKAKGNCLLATMTTHPSLHPRSPPSAGAGYLIQGCTTSCGPSWPARGHIRRHYCAIGGEQILMATLGKGLELCSQCPPPSFSQVPRSAWRKGCSSLWVGCNKK